VRVVARRDEPGRGGVADEEGGHGEAELIGEAIGQGLGEDERTAFDERCGHFSFGIEVLKHPPQGQFPTLVHH
jgi:hypothetical protein